MNANPIRRVVSMLQSMQKKVEKESEEEEALFAKFECSCETSTKELTASVADEKQQIDDLSTAIETDSAQKKQVDEELVRHKAERDEANKVVAEATSLRKKENKDFESESADLKANLEAMKKAIAAIEKGTSSAFLQTTDGAALLKAVSGAADDDKETITDFFQQGSQGAGSDEIVGILKTMVEEMAERLADIEKAEAEAVANFEALSSAKSKEIAAATEAIEEKTARTGELAVKIATDSNDLKSVQGALAADESYLEELTKDCAEKKKLYEEAKQTRADEIVAIADTIKILNSDDALELFKKSLPSTSLLQVQVTSKELRTAALEALEGHKGSVNLDLIALALRGKKKGMEEVTGMIDGMMNQLHNEQKDDDAKKTYCSDEIDKVEDHIKEVKIQIASVKAHIADDEDAIQTYKTQIHELTKSMKELDKAVAAATEQRKAEHQAYVDEAAQNQAALELLEFAKNRLNKFYNPEQYKEPEPEQLSEEERVEQAYSFVQTSHSKQNSNGVMHLLDMLRNDLKLEMNENKMEEEQAQKAYEKLSSDATAKRSASAESLADKESALAAAEGELLDLKVELKETNGDHMEAKQTESNLHAECDFLIANFEARKQARDDELEALDKAKAVLAGADYSFVQVSEVKFLSK